MYSVYIYIIIYNMNYSILNFFRESLQLKGI